MATNVKKISELEKISSLSSSSNVIIEENGKAKRFAASNIGGKVKTVNGIEPDENGNIEIVIPEVEVPEIQEQIQSDFSQNDPTQPDYVKNRTHWEENNQTVIEWDGNIDGKYNFAGYYKVSEATPLLSEVVGGKVVIPGEGEVEITDVHDAISDQGMYMIPSAKAGVFMVIVVLSIVDGAPEGLETGVYFSPTMPIGTSLVYGNQTIHQLDEKFIPDSIARKDDVNVFLITLTMGDNVEDDTGAHDYSCRADRTYDEVNAAFVAGKHIVLRYDSNVYNFSNYTNYENFTLAFVENGEFHFTYVAYGESPYQCIKSGEVVLDSQGNWTYTLIHKQILPTSDAEDEPQMLLGDKYGWFTNPLFCHEVPSVTEENNGAFLQVVNGVWTAVNLTDVSTEGA